MYKMFTCPKRKKENKNFSCFMSWPVFVRYRDVIFQKEQQNVYLPWKYGPFPNRIVFQTKLFPFFLSFNCAKAYISNFYCRIYFKTFKRWKSDIGFPLFFLCKAFAARAEKAAMKITGKEYLKYSVTSQLINRSWPTFNIQFHTAATGSRVTGYGGFEV